ncbi:MAG: hypothetical protein ACTHZ7_08545 [Sphingobacterium sp.]
MRRFFTYILLISLTLQSFYRSIAAMEYQIHLPEYIARCINKDKPELHCNGQCILMEKIREKEKEESKQNLLVYEYSSLYVHKEYAIFTMLQPAEDAQEEPTMSYRVDYHFDYNTPIFRPPIS